MTDDKIKYDFVNLGDGLAKALIKAAEDQVEKAQTFLDQTKEIAGILRSHVETQAQQIDEMTARFKDFGSTMHAAHLKLANEQSSAAPMPKAQQLSPPPNRRVVEAEDNLHKMIRARTKEENQDG